MTTYVKASVTLPNVDGLAVDEFVNDFSFKTAGTPDYGALGTALENFYDAIIGDQVNPLSWYLSTSVSRSAPAKVAMYDVSAHLAGTPAGPPVAYHTFVLGEAAPGQHPLPNQDCAVASIYSSLNTVGETTPSHRGRIYFGPLLLNTVGTTSNPILFGPFTNDLLITSTELQIHAASALWSWCVWSRKRAAMDPVIGGFIQDRIDTQRRRVRAATSRASWTI